MQFAFMSILIQIRDAAEEKLHPLPERLKAATSRKRLVITRLFLPQLQPNNKFLNGNFIENENDKMNHLFRDS